MVKHIHNVKRAHGGAQDFEEAVENHVGRKDSVGTFFLG